MGRSLWFRVYAIQLIALLRLAFASAPHFLLNLAGPHNSPVHSSIGTPSTLLLSGLRLLVNIRFHLSFTVLYAIGHWVVFRLGGWSPRLPTGFLVSRGTLVPSVLIRPSPTWLSHSPAPLPRGFGWASLSSDGPQPRKSFLLRFGLLPRSLAATWGISFDFFSSGYLDVSVRPVPSHTQWHG